MGERRLKEKRSKKAAAELKKKAAAKVEEVKEKTKASELNTKVQAKWLAQSAFEEKEHKKSKSHMFEVEKVHGETQKKPKKVVKKKVVKKVVEKPIKIHPDDDGQC